jgi:two-component system, LuxR family, response regulator FixJ
MTVRTDPPHAPGDRDDGHPSIVYLVDDDPNFRKSVRFLLESVGLVVREFATAGEFLDAAPFDPHGCVLLDHRLPDLSGTNVLSRLKSCENPPAVVFVTAFPSTDLVVRMMREGALAVLEKPLDKDELLATLKSAREPNVQRASERAERKRLDERFRDLRSRELETLDLMVVGLTKVRELSEALGISPRTVEGYRSQLMAKTGCSSIAEVVRLAMRRRELRDRLGGE